MKFNFKIRCDCKGSLNSVNYGWRYMSNNHPQADILRAINNARQELKINIEGLHVKGHQDRMTSLEKIDRWGAEYLM